MINLIDLIGKRNDLIMILSLRDVAQLSRAWVTHCHSPPPNAYSGPQTAFCQGKKYAWSCVTLVTWPPQFDPQLITTDSTLPPNFDPRLISTDTTVNFLLSNFSLFCFRCQQQWWVAGGPSQSRTMTVAGVEVSNHRWGWGGIVS